MVFSLRLLRLCLHLVLGVEPMLIFHAWIHDGRLEEFVACPRARGKVPAELVLLYISLNSDLLEKFFLNGRNGGIINDENRFWHATKWCL